MDKPAVGTSLCERCHSLLRFDDLASGCREVTSEAGGQARLSYEGAKVEWRHKEKRDPAECKLIRLRWHLDDTLPDLPQLSSSSQAGCNFCTSLLWCLEDNQTAGNFSTRFGIRDGPVSLTAYISLRGGKVEGLVVELVSPDSEGDDTPRVFFPIEASLGCQEWLGAEPVRHDSYLASENLGQISRVLAECTGNCHPWKETSFLPTRLIDVGAELSDIPRLVLSSNIPAPTKTKYAALSYCWGNKFDAAEQLMTQKATLKQRFEGIPFDIMTQSTKDAIELTRAVGLRYVWIDALCIIQDDGDDWSYEAGQMHRVYSSAFVTFCGLASGSCHESFLQRVRTATIPFQSALRPTIDGYLSVRLEPIFSSWHVHGTRVLDYIVSLWRYRAWIFQEERLSTRLLLFGPFKMHFRCGRNQWSEGDGKLRRLDEDDISLHDRVNGIKQGKYPASSLYEVWNFSIHQYTVRLLTQETDRLPALSGLARLVGETLGDQYVAGLWRGDLLLGLSWKGSSSSRGLQSHLKSIRERTYVAPSWSWASMDITADHNYPYWSVVPECTVLDVTVETDSVNPYGRVHGGLLRIKGKVVPVPSSLRNSGRKDEWSYSARGWVLRPNGDQEHVVAWLDWHRRDEEEGLENLLMLLLHHQKPPEQPTSSHPDPTNSPVSFDELMPLVYSALLLYPTETKDEYYRVGVVHARGEAGIKEMRSWFEGGKNEKVCTIV